MWRVAKAGTWPRKGCLAAFSWFFAILTFDAVADCRHAQVNPLSKSIEQNMEALGITLDDIVTLKGKTTELRLPLGYLYPRPNAYTASCMISRCNPQPEAATYPWKFELWASDGAFPLASPSGLKLRRCETGRSPGDYLIRVWHVNYNASPTALEDEEYLFQSSDDIAHLARDKMIVNGNHPRIIPYKIYNEKHHDLIKYQTFKIHLKMKKYLYYFDDGDLIANIACEHLPPNKVCFGVLWRTSLQLSWRVFFPLEKLGDWRNLSSLVEGKLLDWRPE